MATKKLTSEEYAKQLAALKMPEAFDTSANANYQKQQQLLADYENNQPFNYNVENDQLYKQYADIYERNARKAMNNAVGKTQAATGGYGNTYSQYAGQQAYNDTMNGLNDIVPQLYQLALNRYDKDRQEKLALADVYGNLGTRDYSMSRDRYNDTYNERNYLANMYQTVYGNEVSEDNTAYNRLMDKYNAAMNGFRLNADGTVTENPTSTQIAQMDANGYKWNPTTRRYESKTPSTEIMGQIAYTAGNVDAAITALMQRGFSYQDSYNFATTYFGTLPKAAYAGMVTTGSGSSSGGSSSSKEKDTTIAPTAASLLEAARNGYSWNPDTQDWDKTGNNYKTPTTDILKEALDEYNEGGDKALLQVIDRYPQYDPDYIADYAIKYGYPRQGNHIYKTEK